MLSIKVQRGRFVEASNEEMQSSVGAGPRYSLEPGSADVSAQCWMVQAAIRAVQYCANVGTAAKYGGCLLRPGSRSEMMVMVVETRRKDNDDVIDGNQE